jgi:hypothetical protein
MWLTEAQKDWVFGSVLVVLLVIAVAVAFWPERWRRK